MLVPSADYFQPIRPWPVLNCVSRDLVTGPTHDRAWAVADRKRHSKFVNTARLLRMDPFSRVHAATWRGVMQVDLITVKVLREPASSMSRRRRMKLCTFFEQARLALCCEPRKVVRDMPVGPSS